MGKIKENWAVLVFAMLLTLFSNIVYHAYSTSGDNASKDYVDKGDDVLNKKIDKREIKVDACLEKKAEKETVELLRIDILYIRQQNDDIKKMLMEINLDNK